MALAVVHSRALDGFHAPPVRVEVHLTNGLPSFQLVGLADTEVKEARERVRAALLHSGLGFPHNRRITVNLAPADLPKESGRFDLPIAVGILAAAGQIDASRLAGLEFAGELSLAGELRAVRGAVALAMALRRDGAQRALVLPTDSAAQAARVSGVTVLQAAHLLDVHAALIGGEAARAMSVAVPAVAPAPAAVPDLAEVRGQAACKRVLEIAAVGGHSLLLVGPPGSGKTLLAQRLPGLLPPMSEDEAMTSAALQGLDAQGLEGAGWGKRPLRTPHHTASAVALVGGGSPPRPGEISLAHGGVLFLDELVEFPRAALEALREPLESGVITLSRAARRVTYPARFQFVAAMNPCPCGWLGAAQAARPCRCTADAIVRYQARLSGPLLDRIDLQIEVPALPASELLVATAAEPSAAVAVRVARARQRALDRQGTINADLDPAGLQMHARLASDAQTLLLRVGALGGWSGRSVHRTLKVARSIADLAGADTLAVSHVAEALQYRRGLPGA